MFVELSWKGLIGDHQMENNQKAIVKIVKDFAKMWFGYCLASTGTILVLVLLCGTKQLQYADLQGFIGSHKKCLILKDQPSGSVPLNRETSNLNLGAIPNQDSWNLPWNGWGQVGTDDVEGTAEAKPSFAATRLVSVEFVELTMILFDQVVLTCHLVDLQLFFQVWQIVS